MRTPIRTVPYTVERWTARLRYLRWLDALAAWLLAWPIAALVLERAADAEAFVAAIGVALLALVRPLRLRWRPVSAWIGVAVSRGLRPGDRAWYVTPGRAELVIVTARRGLRLVVARPGLGSAEGLEVRRTRVLIVPPPV